jgi:hypothetical protein
MAYGILKCDTVTFTDAGIDKSVTLSGLVQNPTFSGNVTVTGTFSGVTVTGTTANFTSGNFTNISGGTHTITSGVFAAGSAASPSITFTGDLNTGIYSPGADQVAVATNGTGRLFVASNGYVGVGTASPSVALHAVGIGRFESAGATIDLSPSSDTNTFQINRENSTLLFNGTGTSKISKGGSSPGNLQIESQNSNLEFFTGGSERLRITSAGLVGIGTSSVNALLEVNNSTAGGEVQRIEGNYDGSGSVILTNWRRAGGSVAAALKYNDDSSPLCMSIGTTTSHEFRIRTADTDAITIDTSQRVGIGTSAPGAKIHSLQASTGEGLRVDGADSGFSLVVEGGTTYHTKIRQVSIGSGYFSNTPPNNGLIVEGSVGIGTTSPGTTLDVTGITRTSTYFSANDNGYIRGDTAGELRIQAGTNGTIFRNSSNSAEYARIDSSGRLLVGTATSVSNVYVASSAFQQTVQVATATNSYANGFTALNYSAVGYASVLTLGLSKNNTLGSDTAISSGDDLGIINFVGNDGTNFRSGAFITATCDGAVSTGDLPTRLVFSTTADGASSPTERLRITSAGLVGIGTSSPSTSLHVIGGGKFASSTTSGSIVQAQNSDLSSLGYFGVEGSTGGVTLTGTLANSTFISSGASGTPLQFGTNGVIRSTLTSTGLGIGTTTPTELLHVGGVTTPAVSSTPAAIRLDNTYTGSPATNQKLKFYLYNDGSEAYGITVGDQADFQYWAGGASTGIHRWFTSNAERARIDSAGNVGIGNTTGLGGTLGVSGHISLSGNGTNTRYLALLNETSTYAGSLVLQAGGGSPGFGGAITMYGHSHATYPGSVFIGTSSSSGGSIIFGTDNAISPSGERVRITSAGLVGIGTSSPSYKLDVSGAAASAIIGAQVVNTDSSGYSNLILRNSGGTAKEYQLVVGGSTSASANNFWLYDATAGQVRLQVSSSGNVGIGTTSPASLLTSYAGNVSTLGAKASTGLLIENNGSVGNVSQIGLGYTFSSTNHPIAIAAVTTSGAGSTRADLVFATRDLTTDVAPTERARIDSSGRLLVGTSSASGANLLQVNSDALVNGLTVGRGASNDSNTAVLGNGALAAGPLQYCAWLNHLEFPDGCRMV